MKSNLSTFELPAVFSDKPAKFTVTVDHDMLHNTNGKVFDMTFHTELGNKLNALLYSKDELTQLNGNLVSNSFPMAAGWSEEVLNVFLRNDVFFQTHNMGYNEIENTPLNPAGVTVTFEFID